MKANEVPEKIYIFEEDLQHEDHIVMYGINQDKDIRGLVEYTRTDVFIEKACEYLNKTCRGFLLTERDIEDFKNYMKGE